MLFELFEKNINLRCCLASNHEFFPQSFFPCLGVERGFAVGIARFLNHIGGLLVNQFLLSKP